MAATTGTLCCVACGYNLEVANCPTCPECGAFHQLKLSSKLERQLRWKWELLAGLYGVACGAAMTDIVGIIWNVLGTLSIPWDGNRFQNACIYTLCLCIGIVAWLMRYRWPAVSVTTVIVVSGVVIVLEMWDDLVQPLIVIQGPSHFPT